MTQEQEAHKRKSLPSAFLRGLAVVAVLYGGLAGWLWSSSSATMQTLQDKMASKTVEIERPAPVYTAAAGTGEPYGPPRPESETAAETGIPPNPSAVLPGDLPRLESGLVESPVEGLYETTDGGRLPKVRDKDGLTPFLAYRRIFDRIANNKPVISIAVVDLGLSDIATENAIRTLPPEISLAVSPYSNTPDLWVNEARARGHEVWMMLPMEDANYPQSDPGPHTMLIKAPERENQIKLSWILSRTTGYVGMIANENPAFLQAVNDVRPVLGNVFSRGLAFVDTSAQPGSMPQSMALGQNAPYASADVWIDSPPTKENIEAAFVKLENIAHENGSATGLIHPLPLSYQELMRWIGTFNDKGLVLAPLSTQTGL